MSQSGFTPILIYGSTTPGNTPSAGNLATSSDGVELAVNAADGKLFYKDAGGVVRVLATTAGSAGDVVGPSSSTDNALVRFDSTTGKLVQNSVGILDDSGNLTGLVTVNATSLEVTNIKAKDGTASASIANSTGVLTVASSVLTTTDINGGTIDGAAIGASTPSTGSFTSLTNSGNLAFTGTGNRITGDFSNATLADRVMFQTSTVNGITSVHAIPNGTGTVGQFIGTNNSDPTNASLAQLAALSTEVSVRSGISGTGTYLPMTFYTGGSERVRIDTSGNVGIGTSAPFADTNYRAVDIRGTTGGQINLGTTSARQGQISSDATNGLTLNTINSTPLRFFTAGTERMRIDSAGNVGIGTSSPAARLDVTGASTTGTIHAKHPGNISFGVVILAETTAGTDDPAIALRNFNGGSPVSYGIVCTDNGSLAFKSGINPTGGFGDERARIDSSGNLLVGDTSPIDSSKLLVTQSGDRTAIAISGNSVGGSTHIRNMSAQANFTAMYMLTSTSTVAGGIYCSGSTTNYATSSDYRLKHDIQPMTGALAKVAQLKPVTYKWNADDSEGQGFIAHELQEVVPECVTGEKDAVDADGNPKYQGIDTSFLVATLAAAIQELKGINDAQAQIITALTARVEALEAK